MAERRAKVVDRCPPAEKPITPSRDTLGNFPVMAKAAAARIAHAKLVEFPDLGHSPQIQDPAAFHKALLDDLIKP